ncbi:hypothetical protein Aca07nite_59040 [Actinoplanes capillaceus]|uniref:Uncharacterized protein n=1 Tax=Actinoplanes campanulatus TaxID=113559 RepID=A0ABQ3WR26_9ACTN|nr:hypothetical protein [Actinoplanes capillaceus]GID48629.1 hypothetical protein Aca07nite_59040 [Actinoplanes capillaceus]
MPARVDLLVFEWAPRLPGGGSGLGVVESTLPAAQRQVWAERLERRVSVPSGGAGPSTCYLRYGDQAALLHRFPVRDVHNRWASSTQVLVGPPSVITMRRAVALRPDLVPQRFDQPADGYPRSWADASDPAGDLDRAARLHRGTATVMVAELGRARPHGWAVRAGDIDPRALLWAVAACLGDMEFSTRETEVTDPDLPTVVFVDGPPARSSVGTARHWVDLGAATDLPGRDLASAADLVETHTARRGGTGPRTRDAGAAPTAFSLHLLMLAAWWAAVAVLLTVLSGR